jgi:ubiquinone/menaquinone biosynthesis C-methylase UbiE
MVSHDFSTLETEGWQRVAGKYPDVWSALTRLFVPDLLEAAAVAPGMRVLDVACGPGYVAEAARARGADPIGVDFCAEMIALARARSPHIEFHQGDAQALEFADDSFDMVLMNFGLLHFPNPQAALAEARRVLRRGGRFGFTVWASPRESPGAAILDDALKAHADMSVHVPKGPDYFGYGRPDECREALTKAGFDAASILFRTVTHEWRVPTASFLFEAERDAAVRTAAVLAAQTPQALGAIQRRIEDSVRAYQKGDGFSIPYAAHVIAVSRGGLPGAGAESAIGAARPNVSRSETAT